MPTWAIRKPAWCRVHGQRLTITEKTFTPRRARRAANHGVM